MYTFLICLAVLVIYLAHERRNHEVRLSFIPLRIHVNGTRGKSSVTRLIYGALREAGTRVVGKTTGTNPRYLDVEGDEHPIPRVGSPNVREQVKAVHRAFREEAEAIVFECMALQPELQKLTEHQMLRASVGVITNVRPDHLDVMGPSLTDVARAIAGSIPRNSVLFTSEDGEAALAVLQSTARRLGTRVVIVPADGVSPDDLRGFRYVEHASNVALALAVAEHVGVDRSTALRGMWKVRPDAGALRIHETTFGTCRVRFVSAFAANDPDSTARILAGVCAAPDLGRLILVVACRNDRVQRSEQMGDFLAEHAEYDTALLVGGETRITRRRALRQGADAARVLDLGDKPVDVVMERIVELAGRMTTVVGIGNIVGFGEELAARFEIGREIVDVLH